MRLTDRSYILFNPDTRLVVYQGTLDECENIKDHAPSLKIIPPRWETIPMTNIIDPKQNPGNSP